MAKADQPTILVVDDYRSNRLLFERLLARKGYTVAHASNGVEAIQVAESLLPHVILMDVIMPVMNGLDAIRKLRENRITAGIPIIIISAKDEEEDVLEGLSAGADEYIVKPIEPKDLYLRIQSMVRLREAQLEIVQTNTFLEAQTKFLTKLNRFSELALADNSFENTCRQIVETTSDIMESKRVSLLVPDISKQTLSIAYALGIERSLWSKLTIPVTRSISGHVFRTQEEMVVNKNTPQPPTINRYDSVCFISIPLICTPIRATDGPIAVLNVTEKTDSRDYQPEDVERLRQLAQTAALALNNVLTHHKLDQIRDSIIISMAKLNEYRHTPTGKHIERVQELSQRLARQLAGTPPFDEIIDDQFILDIRRAAPLHDIGKVSIPDHILLKKGKLTDAEFREMQKHAHIGAETLRSVISNGHDAGFLKMAMNIAHYHHERYDGTGYPEQLAGEQIPLCARIVCLVDSYDAIRTEREYKAARSHEEAIEEIIKASNSQLDPRVVEAFCTIEKQFRETYDALTVDQNVTIAAETDGVLVAAGGYFPILTNTPDMSFRSLCMCP
ncbi:MAG: response regulator, partial [Planctomycetota bacterium]